MNTLKWFRKNGKFSLFYVFLIFFALTGMECDDLLNISNTDITGDWMLVSQSGAAQDVCSGENVDFQSNGVAILQCPGSTAISRNYDTNNGILTYESTGVQYNIDNVSSTTLNLTGINVDRNLEYQSIITDSVKDYTKDNAKSVGENSSEILK